MACCAIPSMAPTPHGDAPAAAEAEVAAGQDANSQGVAPMPVPKGVRNFGNQRRMINELERINALNLEPSLPKAEDGGRTMNRYSQDRDSVKNDFEQFLGQMKKQDAAKEANATGSSGSRRLTNAPIAKPPGQGAPIAAGPAPVQPMFTVAHPGPTMQSLGEVFDKMLQQASMGDAGAVEPDWPDAKGPTYRDVLGQVTGKGGGPAMPNEVYAASMNKQGPQGNDQMQQQRMPQGHGPQGGMQQGQGGYIMPGAAQQGGGQPGQMMFQMPGMGQGPQGMQPMQGMQGGQMMMMGGQGGQMMFPAGPGGQQMMMIPQQGGPQGGPGGQQQYGGDQQQQMQMMYMPVMQGNEQAGGFMQPQGMQQGYQQQGNNNGYGQQGGNGHW